MIELRVAVECDFRDVRRKTFDSFLYIINFLNSAFQPIITHKRVMIEAFRPINAAN